MYRNWQHHFEQSDRLISMGTGTEAFFHAIEKELPPVLSRAEAVRITGGLISAKTLRNEDSLRKGPSEGERVGSKVGYTRSGFMTYLLRKLTHCRPVAADSRCTDANAMIKGIISVWRGAVWRGACNAQNELVLLWYSMAHQGLQNGKNCLKVSTIHEG